MSYKSENYLWLKWHIFIQVFPITLMFCLLKLLIHQQGWELGTFDSQTGSLLASVTFISAFILSGTLQDYRMSEDLPLQIANTVKTIEDTNLMVAARKPDYNPQPLREGLFDVVESVLLWLEQDKPIEQVDDSIKKLNQLFVPLWQNCEAPLMSRVQSEQEKMRLSIARIERIRDTDFVISAYTLLQILSAASLMALLVISTKEFMANLVVSGFICLALVYLLLLIYDLDNPFEYNGKSSVDVTLYPLKRLEEELRIKN